MLRISDELMCAITPKFISLLKQEEEEKTIELDQGKVIVDRAVRARLGEGGARAKK